MYLVFQTRTLPHEIPIPKWQLEQQCKGLSEETDSERLRVLSTESALLGLRLSVGALHAQVLPLYPNLPHVPLWEGYHERRRCSRDTCPESYIAE